MIEKIEQDLKKLREKKPLILNLTNYVTMEFMANALLSLGAAPIMSVCNEEIEELINMSDAININIGTLNNNWITLALLAARTAAKLEKPVILDPVGAGATKIRTETAKKLLPYSNIIKGNASEILALYETSHKTLGVEAIHTTDQAKNAACNLALKTNSIIVVSGKTDFITDGNKNTYVEFGSHLMPYLTGMGCTLASVIASFTTINKNYLEASINAISYFTLCGNLASKATSYPGSFYFNFIDELFKADFNKMKKYINSSHLKMPIFKCDEYISIL